MTAARALRALWILVLAAVASAPVAAAPLDAPRNAFQKGDYVTASTQLEKVLRNTRLSDIERVEAWQLTGRTKTRTAEFPAALNALEAAQKLADEAGARRLLALTHLYKGDVLERMKRHEDALGSYERSLSLLQPAEDWREAREVHTQIGDVHVAAGRYDQAHAAYGNALSLAQSGRDFALIAASHDYLGYFFRSIGNPDEAIRHHQRAITVVVESADKPGASREAWPALARAYNHLGLSLQASARLAPDVQRRKDLLQRAHAEEVRALFYAERAQDHWRQGYVLRALSDMGREMAELPGVDTAAVLRVAAGYAEQAHSAARKTKTSEWIGLALQQRALVLAQMGQFSTSARYFNDAVSLWRDTGDRYALGTTLGARAEKLHEKQNRRAEARNDYLAALESFSGIGARNDAAQMQHRLSVNLARDGLTAAAVMFGKLAVNTVQSMRTDMTTLERNSQRAFMALKTATYRHLADLLITEGRLSEAQQVLGMLKEEEFFDFILRDAGEASRSTTAGYNATEQPWAKRYEQLRERSAAVTAARGKSASKAAETRQAFIAFMDELLRETAELDARRQAQTELRSREIEGVERYQADLAALGPGVALLHYVVLPDKVRIILSTAEEQTGYAGKIDERELNRKIQQLRDALRYPLFDPRPLARELHQVLVAPIANELERRQVHTLLLSLDGVLRYIPFAALYDGQRYLIERQEIVMVTQAADVRFAASAKPATQFTGLGVTHEVPGFDPLPAVKNELESILSAGGMPGEIHLDEAFTANRLRQTLNSKAPLLLHLASHFVFRPGTEADSFLLLGDGQRLTLRELRVAKYNFREVDLLTLSACDTAVSSATEVSGREIESLGMLAQQRGARAVMATLWPVADDSTSIFMSAFYRLLTGQPGLSKADALRQAQLGLLRGEIIRQASPSDTTKAGNATYSHPFFWAPFILIGDWR